jgi:hypothetical protein
MLGLAMVVLPNQPLIYVTVTLGMLIEFPHLIALKVILLRRFKKMPYHQTSDIKLDTLQEK